MLAVATIAAAKIKLAVAELSCSLSLSSLVRAMVELGLAHS
jgi:hypothetical protein